MQNCIFSFHVDNNCAIGTKHRQKWCLLLTVSLAYADSVVANVANRLAARVGLEGVEDVVLAVRVATSLHSREGKRVR